MMDRQTTSFPYNDCLKRISFKLNSADREAQFKPVDFNRRTMAQW